MLKREDRDRKESPNDEIIAFLGKGTEFKGVITYQGTIRIDGHVEGEIITEGALVVGESAVIKAEISAGTVISSGKIIGNITALEKIQLLPPSVHEGSLKTPLLVIEEGVRFNGQCLMTRPGGSATEEAMASFSRMGEGVRGT